jgi:hypothetical protein
MRRDAAAPPQSTQASDRTGCNAVSRIVAIVFALVWPVACAFAAEEANAADVPSVRVVAFGLSDMSEVFRKEATKSARIAGDAFAVSTPPIARWNFAGHSEATFNDVRRTLKAVGAQMKRDDILFLILTSHGGRNGAVITSKTGADEYLSPARLSSILSVSGIKRRVIVVSACYSGVFADMLADQDTLVITAADGWHPSFGCGEHDEWTYFGEAFFSQALPNSSTLRQAFEYADQIVYWREFLHGFAHSNPQMRGGEAILPLLPIHRGGPQDGNHFGGLEQPLAPAQAAMGGMTNSSIPARSP